MRKITLRGLAAIIVSLAALTPGQALAWRHWYGGAVFIAPPIFVPPPIYLGPPVVYAPSPYAPRPYAAAQTCYAGAYICPLDQPAPYGGGCSCPTNNGRAYGAAR
jgi:hypothetical protein